MYKAGSNVDSKFEKNKFESSISELKIKSFVSAADIGCGKWCHKDSYTIIIYNNKYVRIKIDCTFHLEISAQNIRIHWYTDR